MSFHLKLSAVCVAMTAGWFALPAVAEPMTNSPLLHFVQAQQGELEAFAAAYIKIVTIQQTMQQDLETSGVDDASGMQAEAQAAMVAAVEAEGLTVEQYNTIAHLMQTDEQVAAQIQGLIQEQLGG